MSIVLNTKRQKNKILPAFWKVGERKLEGIYWRVGTYNILRPLVSEVSQPSSRARIEGPYGMEILGQRLHLPGCSPSHKNIPFYLFILFGMKYGQ